MKRTKKSLAFVLAVAMMLTLIPASVFATTTNEVARVATVKADEVMDRPVELTMTIKNANGTKEDQSFRLTLENAVWEHEDDAKLGTWTETNDVDVEVELEDGGSATTIEGILVDDNTMDVNLTGVDIPKDGYILVRMYLKAGDEAGEVKVKVEDMGSGDISTSDMVIAIVAGGDTVSKVLGTVKKVTRGNGQECAKIEIREAAINSVGKTEQQIKLTLPKGFEWNSKTTATGLLAGGDISDIDISGDDSRDLFITFTGTGNGRDAITITPFIDVTRDAKAGDVSVQLRSVKGDISKDSGLVIATYGDDGVTVSTVKEKDIPTITAGFAKDADEDVYTVKVTLEEVTPGSLIDNKYVEFEFPKWVQLAEDDEITVKLNGSDKTKLFASDLKESEADITKDTSVIEWTVDTDMSGWNKNTKTNKIEFEFPVTVEAKNTGDLELTVRGPKAGVEETKIVVAKIVAPITADINIADLRTGIQSQAGGTIVIKETEAGMIRDGKYRTYDNKGNAGEEDRTITLSISDLGFNGMKFDDATVKVTKGDLEIDEDNVDVDDGVITIPIDRNSIKEAAEITISDVTLNLNRTMPEGDYNVKIGGGAVVDNSYYNDDDFASNAIDEKYLNIITPADGNVYGTAKFQLGAKEYSVLINGKEQTYQMDTAAFTQNQRTMIPVKFVALALGVSEDNVVWNGTAKTATFFKGDRVCVLTAGSNIMNVNGAEVVMDTNAFVKDKRIFVPIKYVANALGCSVDWDGETKTVTINQ